MTHEEIRARIVAAWGADASTDVLLAMLEGGWERVDDRTKCAGRAPVRALLLTLAGIAVLESFLEQADERTSRRDDRSEQQASTRRRSEHSPHATAL